ncbi:camphor resistance protein CrcB [Paraphotobacterium marinum]|uniref:Fluoride-specific ion channel FluC n=1 Tax=Paraphotobacterium marinum TaxID=1755811 RepID=A0A220VD98_9GAMM|nr:fluoride efflux transporter CrcB [Paraphotobacterium marinum]ASK78152.1 camphor resistance protein CrcB [Paraphotobacterium marinum]
MNQIITLLYVAMGGAVGCCSRYLISELMAFLFGKNFPYGTLTVNVVGGLLMGILGALFQREFFDNIDPYRQIIGLGFLGGLTTFSTFSMDSILLLQSGMFFKFCLNIILNVVLSLSACWVGFHLLFKN